MKQSHLKVMADIMKQSFIVLCKYNYDVLGIVDIDFIKYVLFFNNTYREIYNLLKLHRYKSSKNTLYLFKTLFFKFAQ